MKAGPFRALRDGVRVLFRRGAADRDLSDEMQHYLDELVGELERAGTPPAAARREALRRIGSLAAVRDEVRFAGWENLVSTTVDDLRQAVRRFRATPISTLVSVATLAVGIGASTAIFSAVNPVLFAALPYPHAEALVAMWDRAGDESRVPVTFGTFEEIRHRSRSFASMAVARPWQPVFSDGVNPERLDGQRVSAEYFRTLSVHPLLGRDFTAADDVVNGPRVVVISHAFWQRRFHGDPTLVGKTVQLNGTVYSLVGVMPRTFDNVLLHSADVWTPLQYDASLPSAQGREWGHHLSMIARLRIGVNAAAAQAELLSIARTPRAEFARMPWASMPAGLMVIPLRDDLARSVRPALIAVLGAVTLLLAIACVNVVNLQLARSAHRRGEFAVRTALGAGRLRLVRQLVTESLLLAAVGGLAAVALAQLGTRALISLTPPDMPRVEAMGLDRTALMFAMAITTIAGVLFGVIPARQAARHSLSAGLAQGSRRTVGEHHRLRRTLVIAEVALASMLLVGSGLLLRSVGRLLAVPPGFDPSHVLSMRVQVAGPRFNEAAAIEQFFDRSLEAVRKVPGVVSAAYTTQLPLSGDLERYGLSVQSPEIQAAAADNQSALRYAVTPGYFRTMGIPVISGRDLDARDVAGAPIAALINASLARRKFPHGDALGQHIRLGSDNQPWYTVVGVVGDVKQVSLEDGANDAVYLAPSQWYTGDVVRSLVVRAQGDAASMAPAIRRAIASVDPDQPVMRVVTMDRLIATSAAQRRFVMILFEGFGLTALILAAVGLYGILSGSVTERMRELGVRSALGATNTNILRMILGQGLALVMAGLVIGVGASLIASRTIQSLLFGVARLDLTTYVGMMAVLLAVSIAACWAPATRASRVDPARMLRE